MSTVTISAVDYSRLLNISDAYNALVDGLWPVVIIFLVLAIAEAVGLVYWWWRCQAAETQLGWRKQPDQKKELLYLPLIAEEAETTRDMPLSRREIEKREHDKLRTLFGHKTRSGVRTNSKKPLRSRKANPPV